MPIVADLDDLAPAEFLLMLSLNRKTGKLTGTKGEDKVVVAMRNGSIVYAASTAVREKIGSLLVGRGLVSEAELRAAISRQEQEPGVKHLGNILLEMGAIEQAALAEVVRSQFQRIIGEMMSWEEGVLAFTRMDIPDLGAIHVSPREILVDMGFETEQLVLGGMTELEDSSREAAGAAAGRAAAEASASTGEDRIRDPGAPAAPQPVMAPLPDPADEEFMRSMMVEMDRLSVAITAEVTLEVLQNVAAVVRRAVLMVASPTVLTGAGGFGVGRVGETAEDVVRRFSVARDGDTVFSRVLVDGRPYLGPLPDTVGNKVIVELLGGVRPVEVMAVPLVVRGQIAAIVYGDNLPGGEPIGSLEDLIGRVGAIARFLEDGRT